VREGGVDGVADRIGQTVGAAGVSYSEVKTNERTLCFRPCGVKDQRLNLKTNSARSSVAAAAF